LPAATPVVEHWYDLNLAAAKDVPDSVGPRRLRKDQRDRDESDH
jgi:hypothetical protein